MLTDNTLYNIAKSRFDEAKILRDNNKPDGAIYLCGYSLELILKRRIVRHLNWNGYPGGGNEFNSLASYKTHNLDILLKLAGLEKFINSDNKRLADWQIAKEWNSEIRYRDIGVISQADCKKTIESIRNLINTIYKLS